MMNKGIYTIADLADENGSFKPWIIASLEFSLEPVEFLRWYGFLQCIPTLLSHLTLTDFIEKV